MVIFLLGEDRAYLSWLAHHRGGFVLDWLRKPTNKKPVLHRASCAEIRIAKTRDTHWTTGRHVKVCSLDIEELVAWSQTESGDSPVTCDVCAPLDPRPAVMPADERHLTKLGKEIVDYVVEAAVIHLDRRDAGYDVTVLDIANYLDKTPRQIMPALSRLAEDEYIRLEAERDKDSLNDDDTVFPTADAMRTLPAFAKLPLRSVEVELNELREEE